MTDIVLKKLHGFEVRVSDYSGEFAAYDDVDDDHARYRAKSLAELEEILKRHASDARHFDPIDVIHISDERIGKITSRVADNKSEVYFTHKERPTDKPTRTQIGLMASHWDYSGRTGKPQFAKVTPENLAIKAKIEDLQKQAAKLHEDAAALRDTYGDLVTWETIGVKDPAKEGGA